MTRKPRRLNLLDLMILMAAVPIGLSWSQYQYGGRTLAEGSLASLRLFPILANAKQDRAIELEFYRVAAWLGLVGPAIMVAGIALLAMALREPKRRWPRTLRQPGVAACAATILAFAMDVVRSGMAALENYRIALDPRFSHIYPWQWEMVAFDVLKPAHIGFCVASAWMALWLAGALRSGRSWIDYLGRVLGVYWIVLMLLSWVIF